MRLQCIHSGTGRHKRLPHPVAAVTWYAVARKIKKLHFPSHRREPMIQPCFRLCMQGDIRTFSLVVLRRAVHNARHGPPDSQEEQQGGACNPLLVDLSVPIIALIRPRQWTPVRSRWKRIYIRASLNNMTWQIPCTFAICCRVIPDRPYCARGRTLLRPFSILQISNK